MPIFLPETVQALTVAAKQIKQTAGEFDRTAGQLANSYTGTAEQARRAIDQMRSTISSATDTANRAANDLKHSFLLDYKWSICATSLAAMILGFFLGILYHRWINPPLEELRPAPAAVQQQPMPMAHITSYHLVMIACGHPLSRGTMVSMQVTVDLDDDIARHPDPGREALEARPSKATARKN